MISVDNTDNTSENGNNIDAVTDRVPAVHEDMHVRGKINILNSSLGFDNLIKKHSHGLLVRISATN